MQENDAMDFYQRIVQGTKKTRTIELEHDDGYTLTGVEMHPIDKKTLAGVIERLPEEMFEAVEDAEGDPEEAQEEMDGDLSAVTEDTVEAFEDLLHNALDHPDLTTSQIRQIVNALNFELLFELGTEVIDMSVEETGEIQSFHERE
jgi:hypothetical protein